MTSDDSVLASPTAALRSAGLAEVVVGTALVLLDALTGAAGTWTVVGAALFVAGHVLVGCSYVAASRAGAGGR